MPLARVLEAEAMDSPQEAVDYDMMDHAEVNRVFVTDLLETGGNDLGDDILDLGTGTAQIPVLLCRQHETCRVMAVDLAISMLELARYNIEVAGLIQRVQLAQIDAKQLPFPDDQFDVAISNSIVHHIAEPVPVLREAVRVTRPAGLIFFRDLMRPDSEAMVSELVERYAGNENQHQQQMFDDSLRAALTLEEIRALVAELGFDPQSVAATSDRHWTWSAKK